MINHALQSWWIIPLKTYNVSVTSLWNTKIIQYKWVDSPRQQKFQDLASEIKQKYTQEELPTNIPTPVIPYIIDRFCESHFRNLGVFLQSWRQKLNLIWTRNMPQTIFMVVVIAL